MKKWLGIFAVIIATALLSGCEGTMAQNVEHQATPVKNVSDADMVKAIKAAGAGLGWVITEVKPGLMKGTLNLRSHTAVVNIPYTSNDYSIEYVSSNNLDYNAEKNTIHKNYNSWVQNLKNAIDVQIAAQH